MTNLSDLFPAGAGKQVAFTASENIAKADCVSVKADGQIQKFALEGFGNVTTISATETSWGPQIVYDTNEDKTVFIYADPTDSSKPKASVLSITSGGVVTFNSPTTISSDAVYYGSITAVFTNNNKICVCYHTGSSGSSNLRVYLGTVSGTSISFTNSLTITNTGTTTIGQRLALDTGDYVMLLFGGYSGDFYPMCQVLDVSGTDPATYSNQLVLNSSGGVTAIDQCFGVAYSTGIGWAMCGTTATTKGQMWFVTRSSTTITLQQTTVVTGKAIRFPALVWSGSGATFWIAFADSDDGYKGYVNGITFDGGYNANFGTWHLFNTNNGYYNSIVTEGETTSFKLYYNNYYASVSDAVYQIAATQTSGEEITIGTEVAVSSFGAFYPYVIYDPDQSLSVMAYAEKAAPYYQAAATSASGGNETFIGVADAAISSSASGNVTLKGGICTNVTGLTVGSDYYVQNDATLGTGATSKKAGKALSATAINLEYTS